MKVTVSLRSLVSGQVTWATWLLPKLTKLLLRRRTSPRSLIASMRNRHQLVFHLKPAPFDLAELCTWPHFADAGGQ